MGSQNAYWLYHARSLKDDSFKSHADYVWRIIKYECHKGQVNSYKILEGDMIKFGRVRFIIRKLVIDADDVEDSAAEDG